MRTFIENLARKAGETAIRDYSKLDTHKTEFKSAKDVVTFADREVEDLIVSTVHAAFPDDNLYGEERGDSVHTGSRVRWIIDPIDGTAAFERGQYYFSISIAREENGRLTHGAVYAPRMNELFYAEAGKGALLNGRAIHVSDRSELIESTFATGFACLRSGCEKNNLECFTAIMPLVREMRRGGSAALDLCMTAAGRFDFYWEHPLHIYDVAAGIVILREAGGKVTDFDGGDKMPERGLLASNGLLHEKVRSLILRHDYR